MVKGVTAVWLLADKGYVARMLRDKALKLSEKYVVDIL
jgi:hypothetical protein